MVEHTLYYFKLAYWQRSRARVCRFPVAYNDALRLHDFLQRKIILLKSQ
ncbi:hypothetical protein [Oscillatoria sp. FACHB-1406]|nr:hypothetical protein [Oscillatoria sp. FACHB-1406]MBD2576817.1 hypothetical protein [Oscillatoria sp. FACHB-1406]